MQTKTDVLFVGHVPPPWTGQGVIHSMLLKQDYSCVRLVQLPMRFAKTSKDQGKISFGKIVSLLQLIAGTYRARLSKGVRYLYFSPGGPSFSAVLRDALYLLAVRPFMRGTMLVYHSSGVAEYVEAQPSLMRPFLRHAFSRVEVAVQLSPGAPPDGAAFDAKQVIFIPNAVPDHAGAWFPRETGSPIRLLYMGVVTVGKGVLDLLTACQKLSDRNLPFELRVVGSFASPDEEKILREAAAKLPAGSVIFTGPLAGSDKFDILRWADTFCFPSFWYTETFPLVLLEAFSFGLPVIASRWRGIPDLMGESGCGSLVDIHAIDQIAAAIEMLATTPHLRETQSRNARLRYENCFTEVPFYENYEAAFSKLTSS